MSYTESRAITSEFIEKAFAEELRRKKITYYFVFRLIIETDISFKEMSRLKVSDVRGKEAITYTKHSGGKRTAPISAELQKELSDYCAGMNKSESFLQGKNNSNPLHPSTISQVFKSVSETLKIDPPISIKSCHKTFIYKMVLRDGSCTRAKGYLHANSDKNLYDYIGVPAPEKRGRNALIITKDDLIRSGLIESVSDRVNATLYSIERALRSNEPMSDSDCQTTNDFLNRLDSAVSDYRLRKDE